MSSIQLHLEHEKNLMLVNIEGVIEESEVGKKIRLTYEKAIQIISESAQSEEFNDCDFGLEEKINVQYKVIGAALDKVKGHITLFILSQNEDVNIVHKIRWSNYHWQNIGMQHIHKDKNEIIPYEHFYCHFIKNYILYSKGNVFNRDPIFYDINLERPQASKERYLPIEAFNSSNKEHVGFTINYDDILISLKLLKVKNAIHCIDLDNKH